jgi:hypothetical protein
MMLGIALAIEGASRPDIVATVAADPRSSSSVTPTSAYRAWT